ncbi:MAG: hypothetical protein KKC18_14205, partial [Chloroflexi bacterium]|nr:hypothetical protein [Chloroflexota bacterium]
MKTNTSYHISAMLLSFLLLTGAGDRALASPQPRGIDRESVRGETALAALSPPWQPPSPGSDVRVAGEGAPIEPELLRALLEADSDDSFRIILELREQTDLQAAVGGTLSVAETRSRVVSALQATAARSQALLRPYLEGARAAGRIE